MLTDLQQTVKNAMLLAFVLVSDGYQLTMQSELNWKCLKALRFQAVCIPNKVAKSRKKHVRFK